MVNKSLVRVVTAPQGWTCDECGAVIKKGEKCVKIGKRKLCAKHFNERG